MNSELNPNPPNFSNIPQVDGIEDEDFWVSEEISEPMILTFGRGSGKDCDTGNDSLATNGTNANGNGSNANGVKTNPPNNPTSGPTKMSTSGGNANANANNGAGMSDEDDEDMEDEEDEDEDMDEEDEDDMDEEDEDDGMYILRDYFKTLGKSCVFSQSFI